MMEQRSWNISVIDMPGAPGHRTKDAMFSGKQWQQVLARDRSADGQFFYAVKSTRIYCRPSCPSRRPTRRNVSFFATSAQAEQAGFRPCKRCEPNNAAPRLDPQAPLIQAAVNYLAERPTEKVQLEELSRATGASRLTVLRAFRRVLGVSPREYARAQRMALFQDALRPDQPVAASSAERRRRRSSDSPKRITDAIYEVGFGSSSRLYESSAQSLGMKPTALRNGGDGLAIRYTTAACVLGRVIVAASDIGICSIAFAATDAEAVADLRKRFPKAQLAEDKKAAGWLTQGVAFVLSQTSEHPLAATFPLDVRATAFQQRVWKALQEIPRGETRSYSDVARELGRPSAARAVAAAIGSNPIALAIPCHRVIGQDGSLTGYRWGLERKRKLLKAEGSSLARLASPAAVSSQSSTHRP
jgi:AraC family transcriptional regulator of adaptative response/methylated-DNA-[protein]-cysteine methyltransferase